MAKYTYYSLKKFFKQGTNLVKKGKGFDSLDKQLATAAGYALDLIDTAKTLPGISPEERENLFNLNMKGNEAALTVVSSMYFSTEDNTSEKVNDYIIKAIKLLGSYQLFTLCNFFETPEYLDFGIKAEPILQPISILASAPYTPLDSLILQIKAEGGNTVTFDVYKNMWKSLNRDSRFGDIVALGIPSFHEAFRDEVIMKIM